MALISLRAYGRHRGVSLKAVQKAVEAGRISTIPNDKGVPKIDPDVADIQWAQNTRADQQERGSLKDFEKTQADLSNIGMKPADASAPGGSNMLSNEKAETEVIRRQMLELQLAQKRGELVNVNDVERAMAAKLKAANEALNGMADRIAPTLAAETDVNEVDKLLRTEIRRAMNLISQEAAETIQ